VSFVCRNVYKLTSRKGGKTHLENASLPCTEITDGAETATANDSLIQSDEAFCDEEVLPQNEGIQHDEAPSAPSTSTLNAQASEHHGISISNSKGSPPPLKLPQALHNPAVLSTSPAHIPNTSSLDSPHAFKLIVGSTESKLLGSLHLPSLSSNLTSPKPQPPSRDKLASKKVGSL
jgi:hypothetical protein